MKAYKVNFKLYEDFSGIKNRIKNYLQELNYEIQFEPSIEFI